MKKEVYIVYNDNRKPSWDIANITGKKGFGETIFKRRTLKERMKQYYETIPCVTGFYELKDFSKEKSDSNTAVMLIYSDFVISQPEQVETLVNKALYAHENYKIVNDNKIAGVIFENLEAFFCAKESEYESYGEIRTDCFTDISDVNKFRQFITSGFEARFFNSLEGDEYTLIKSSDKKDKLRAEYEMYNLLPDNMKQWFVRPYDFTEEGDKASYKMQRYHMTDLAIRYIHGSIDIDEFDDILDKLFYFISIREKREISKEEYEAVARELYVGKIEKRIELLKQMEGYSTLAAYIESSTDYSSIDEIVEEYRKLFEEYRKNKNFLPVQVVGHGDLCFSNILYSRQSSLLMLIDPKGACSRDELFMDPYYDIAKLSHSICGCYDFFNSDLFEISLDDNMKSRLSVFASTQNYVARFRQKLTDKGIDYKLVRLYEASLFLSMLPFHMDRPKKVYAFILNAVLIMDSLKEQ